MFLLLDLEVFCTFLQIWVGVCRTLIVAPPRSTRLVICVFFDLGGLCVWRGSCLVLNQMDFVQGLVPIFVHIRVVLEVSF